jgi:capsular exopolysaccharide synthesis family protein
MADRQRAEGMDISSFFVTLRRRVLIIVAAMVVGAGAAYYISDQQDPKYSATARLLLQGSASSQPGQDFGAPLPAAAPDRESLLLGGDVVDRVERRLARRIGRVEAARAAAGLAAFSGQDSDVVDLGATASRPNVAALAANTLATENIAFRRETTIKKIRRSQRAVRRQLSRVAGRGSPEAQAAAGQLRTQLDQLDAAASTADGDAAILKRAAPPSSPSSPKPKRNGVIGGFGGLLVGLALALLLEQLDRRVRHSKELEEVFGLPVLAHVPKSRALAGKNGRALDRLPSQEQEAFQMLRANLHYLNTDRELRSIVVTSPGVGDGKSTIALNLAKADASVGKKVLLVEADVRRPRLAQELGLSVSHGLSNFLADRGVSLAEVIHRVPVVQRTNGRGSTLTMDVVVVGNVPDNPSELIDSERMRELIRQAENDYDLVVFDTPPAGIVADAIPLMSEASAVVVVSRVGKITSGEANHLRDQLERIDAPAFGLVANFVRGPDEKAYGYY